MKHKTKLLAVAIFCLIEVTNWLEAMRIDKTC
jgi:hypothetical protein